MVLLEWLANPLNDVYADAVTTVVLEVQSNPKAQKAMETQSAILDMEVFQNRLGVMLQWETRSVCYEDDSLREMVELSVQRLYDALNPVI
ncbi:hypothetical protein CesoFtcFv8_017391 [Champsocephalus esox]|nr:hypothetical protein CesoFtcFv8_017391 [Champsocephalus esox]